MKKLRVAVIGCGSISVMHLTAITRMEDVELVACCDIVKERADEAAKTYHSKAYYDYQTMFDSEKLDAVHICLPHYLHCKVACEAFDRGIHALTEKPMDIDYERAARAVAYAKEKGVLFGVISQCRYNDAAQFVKKTLESGRLGKIISARSILTWRRDDSYYTTSDWKGRWDKEGGGVLINQAIHSVDLTHWMINSEVESVRCTMSNHNHSVIEVEDTVEGFVTYKNGVRYLFYCSNNYGTNDTPEMRLQCEKGRVDFTYDDAYITYNDGTKEEAHRETKAEEFVGGKDYWGVQHSRQIRHFYDSVLGKEPLFLSGEETLKTHKLIMEIYKIGKAGMRS